MEIISSHVRRLCRRGRLAAGSLVLVLACAHEPAGLMSPGVAGEPDDPGPAEPACRFPTVAPDHPHVRALLTSAMRTSRRRIGMIDPVSGYPFEGWNQDPDRGLFLRSFTQLTAIGQFMELLANIVAGNADTPFLSRDQARGAPDAPGPEPAPGPATTRGSAQESLLGQLPRPGHRQAARPAGLRRREAHDPRRVRPGERRSDLEGTAGQGVDRLAKPGPRGRHPAGRQIRLGIISTACWPLRDNATKQKIMDILDQRVVLVVFVDNANLSGSVAKTIGALLAPGDQGPPRDRRAPAGAGTFPRRPAGGIRPAVRREGGPVLLRLGRHQGPAVRLGRPRKENGRPATWTIWSTNSAARPRSSSRGSDSHSMRSRTSASR